jgi:3-oxoacyl-[acyl-carrier-protein] synthase-3
MSCITDQEDRSTAPLFGDGAGALVMRAATRPRSEVLFALMGADGGGANLITIPAGGSAEPASTRTVNERLHTIRMKGREVYKFAVMKMQELVEQTLSETGVRPEELKLVVPHQSNLRIIESAVEKLEIPIERVVVNIDRYGNTSAASVPLALHEGLQTGRCGPGDLILVIAFGAGLTWSAMLIRL